MLGLNFKSAAAWNRALTIRLLRRHGTLSRNDISGMTQLQSSTLSYIVRELLDKEVLRIVGKRETNLVGQKQLLLTLNPDLGWMMGASIRLGSASLVLLDAAGGRIDGMRIPIVGSLESVPAQLKEALGQWLHRRGTPNGKMLGLGIAVTGVVDADAGVVLRSSAFQAVNVPLRELAAREFGVTVVVDHDACYGALAEATDGAAADCAHFTFFSVNTTSAPGGARFNDYGSALYLDGKIYRGAYYGAGELSNPLEPLQMDLTEADIAAMGVEHAGLPPALLVLAGRIGASLGPIVNLVDVKLVVLAGTGRILNRQFIDAVQAIMDTHLIPIPGRTVRVVPSTWEPEASARGAALAAFDAVVAGGQLFGDTDDRKTIRITKAATTAGRRRTRQS